MIDDNKSGNNTPNSDGTVETAIKVQLAANAFCHFPESAILASPMYIELDFAIIYSFNSQQIYVLSFFHVYLNFDI